LSNAYGSGKLLVGMAFVGLRDTGSGVVSGSNRKLTFGGADTTTIAAGAFVISDPVAFDLEPLADIAVSIYLPGDVPLNFGITGRYARQTNYISPPGDFSGETVMPVGRITDDWFFLSMETVLESHELGVSVDDGSALTA